MRIIEPLRAGNIYHIFNRGINSENIFVERRNYYYFLEKYNEYCTDILETYAYALLKNHFHLMVKVRENIFVTRKDGKGEIELNASKQLSHFFNCYAQSFNAAYQRHGKLFEEPFRRVLIDSDQYYTTLIQYIHYNPQHHHFVGDFRDWQFTSWHSIQDNSETFLAREKLIEWFGSKEIFTNLHLEKMADDNIAKYILE